MNLSNPKRVINLSDFLPVDGESKFEMRYVDRVLNLEVIYDKDDTDQEFKRVFIFDQATFFLKTIFPGQSIFNYPNGRNISLDDSLVEYEHSDLLNSLARIDDRSGYKHYRLFLHSVGVAIHVISRSCELSDEMIAD